MIFTTLKLQNILSYEHLEFDLNQRGTVLIVGSNGSGKSSIWDALSWCLFGVTLKGDKGDEVVSLFAGKESCASVEIECGDDVFTITRYRKHSEHKNNLYLTKNGEDLSGWSTDTTQQQIVSILGMGVGLFTNSVMFAQGHSEFFATLSDKDQKEMIENFIDTTGWDYCLEYTKGKLSEVTSELSSVDKDLERNGDRLEFLDDAIADLVEKRDNADEDLKEQQKSASDDLKGAIKSIKAAEAKVKTTKDDLESVAEVVDKLTKLKNKSKNCDKCGQPLPFSKEAELKQAKQSQEGLDRALFQLKIQLRGLESTKNQALETLSELQDTDNAYSETIEKYQQQREQILSDNQDKLKRKEELESSKRGLLFWAEGFSNKGIKSFLFESIIPEFNNLVAGYTEAVTEGMINIALSSTSKLKSGETREKFAVNISNAEGSNRHKSSSGGERRSIDLCIMWTLQDLARSRLKSSISFEVVDEVFDILDEAHVDKVTQVLNSHAKHRTVFVVSHSEALKSSFDTVYLASKTKRKSSLIRV